MLMIDDLQILFYSHPIDMRKSIDSLCVLVTDTLNRNPMDGTLFLFRNKSGNKLKVLYYETNCFTICIGDLKKGVMFFKRIYKAKLR